MRPIPDFHLKIKLFMDGADLSEMQAAYKENIVQGFTTNPTTDRPPAGFTPWYVRYVVTSLMSPFGSVGCCRCRYGPSSLTGVKSPRTKGILSPPRLGKG